MLILRNVSKETLVVELPHQEYCVKVGVCSCVRGAPKAIHFQPGSKIRDLGDAAAQVLAIKNLIASGKLETCFVNTIGSEVKQTAPSRGGKKRSKG